MHLPPSFFNFNIKSFGKQDVTIGKPGMFLTGCRKWNCCVKSIQWRSDSFHLPSCSPLKRGWQRKEESRAGFGGWRVQRKEDLLFFRITTILSEQLTWWFLCPQVPESFAPWWSHLLKGFMCFVRVIPLPLL